MAYKVILVDDELFDLEWLKRSIPWEELRLEAAAVAHSGFDALKIMEEQRFDILLSDIRMPIMTGLSLAQKAKESNPALKVVFISGYDDFEYAKQALSVSAAGYVLKPVNLEEIVQLLRDTVDQLDKERAQHRRSETLDRAMPLIQGAVFTEWLEGSVTEIEGNAILHSYGVPLTGPLNAAIIEIDDLSWKLNGFPKQSREEVLQGMISRITDYVETHRIGFAFAYQQQVTLLIENPTERTTNLLQSLIEEIKASTPFTITIGVGRTCATVEELPDSYGAARESLKFKMYLGKSKIISPDDVRGEVIEGATNVEEKLESLFTSMLHYDLVGIDDDLQQIFHITQYSGTKVTVYNFTLHLISQLDKHFEKLGENLYEILSWDYKNLDVLFQFETVDDIKSWLRRRLFELSELMMLKMQKGNRKVVADMQKYVEEHLQDKITLRLISAELGFTPNYLGHLFREETGENFNDYLTRKRMEKAAEWLADPAMKIYEVSDQVGYKNIIYFNRQFKDFYGITPTEFRRKS